MTTSFDTEVLARFADEGRPVSRAEVFGSVPTARQITAMDTLLATGLLERVPDHADAWGAAQYRPTSAGLRALGRTPPSPSMRGVPGKLKARK